MYSKEKREAAIERITAHFGKPSWIYVNRNEAKSYETSCPIEKDVIKQRFDPPPVQEEWNPVAMEIEHINSKKIGELRYRDYVHLKAGRDEFSSMKINRLRLLVSHENLDTVENEFESEASRASCLRWILRGLDAEKSIKKVKISEEIGFAAASKKPRES